jgi:hypothetical protein
MTILPPWQRPLPLGYVRAEVGWDQRDGGTHPTMELTLALAGFVATGALSPDDARALGIWACQFAELYAPLDSTPPDP